MSAYVTNMVILGIAAVVPVYLIIRMPKLGYPLGVCTVCFLFILRDGFLLGSYFEDMPRFPSFFLHFLVGVSYCTPVYGLKELLVLLRNRKRGIGTARRKKVIMAVVGVGVLLEAPMWWLWVGLVQCYAYRMLVSDPSCAARLSVEPKKIDLQANQDLPGFSLWYARVAIQPELIRSIRLVASTIVFVDCSEWNVWFLRPRSPTYEELNPGLANGAESGLFESVLWRDAVERQPPSIEDLRANPVGRLTLEMVEDPYSWKVKVVNTMPKTYREIFFMERCAFAEYAGLAVAKAFGPACEGDIGIFETESVEGVVLFGWARKPEQVCADVFSRESNIGQGILVRADSPEEAEKAMLSVLASYRFTISKALGKEELREMIMAEISEHVKFEKSGEQGIEE